MTLSRELSARVLSVARRRRIALFSLYLGTLAIVRQASSASAAQTLAIVTSCRSLPVKDLDSTVGLVMNCVPVPLRVPRDTAMIDWLAGLGDELRRWLTFEYLPFHLLQDACAALGLNTELAFNFLNVNHAPLSGAGVVVTEFHQHLTSNFPLGVDVTPGGETHIQVSFDSSAIAASDVSTMLEQWQAVLETFATTPTVAVDAAMRAAEAVQAARRGREVHERRRASLPEWL